MRRLLCVLVVALFVGQAYADIDLDLTTAGSSGTINGAQFFQANPQPTGSGVIHSFVRIGSNQDVEQGYNTDGRPTAFDEKSSATFTHSLQLGEVPTITLNGTPYKQFLLDINQTHSNPLLSLDALQIFLGTSGSLTTTNLTLLGTKVYDLDTATSNNTIELNYALNSGSGSGDMFAFIPETVFAGHASTEFLTLYSSFGIPNSNNDGYEEWSVVVPVPGAVLLGLLGLSAAGIKLRRSV